MICLGGGVKILYSTIASIVLCMSLGGCSAPPVVQSYASLFDSNQGMKISPMNAANLTEILESKSNMESDISFQARANEFFKSKAESSILIDAKGYNNFGTSNIFDKTNDVNGMVSFIPFGYSKGDCLEFESDPINRFGDSPSFRVCSSDGSYKKRIIPLSSSDANRIGDIKNLGVAIHGNLVSPYYKREKFGSKFSYVNYTLYMKNVSIVFYDKRGNSVIGIQRF